MNKLLNNIKWSTYLELCTIIAIAYYAFIAWKYYGTDIQRLIHKLTGNHDKSNDLSAVLQYQSEEHPQPEEFIHYESFPEAQLDEEEFQGVARSLAINISSCIDQAADKSFAPGILIPKLKKILNDHSNVVAMSDRQRINALVTSECEKTGTALLSESEVDLWWSA